jgi:hypothetical protein
LAAEIVVDVPSFCTHTCGSYFVTIAPGSGPGLGLRRRANYLSDGGVLFNPLLTIESVVPRESLALFEASPPELDLSH